MDPERPTYVRKSESGSPKGFGYFGFHVGTSIMTNSIAGPQNPVLNIKALI